MFALLASTILFFPTFYVHDVTRNTQHHSVTLSQYKRRACIARGGTIFGRRSLRTRTEKCAYEWKNIQIILLCRRWFEKENKRRDCENIKFWRAARTFEISHRIQTSKVKSSIRIGVCKWTLLRLGQISSTILFLRYPPKCKHVTPTYKIPTSLRTQLATAQMKARHWDLNLEFQVLVALRSMTKLIQLSRKNEWSSEIRFTSLDFYFEGVDMYSKFHLINIELFIYPKINLSRRLEDCGICHLRKYSGASHDHLYLRHESGNFAARSGSGLNPNCRQHVRF